MQFLYIKQNKKFHTYKNKLNDKYYYKVFT